MASINHILSLPIKTKFEENIQIEREFRFIICKSFPVNYAHSNFKCFIANGLEDIWRFSKRETAGTVHWNVRTDVSCIALELAMEMDSNIIEKNVQQVIQNPKNNRS